MELLVMHFFFYCSPTCYKAGNYRAYDQWFFIPLGGDVYRIMNKHTGFFLDMHKDKETGAEILVQSTYSERDSQKWILKRQGANEYAEEFFKPRSAFSEAMRVFDLTHQFEYYIYGSPYAV